jgi:chemotaxis protein histidine kinase CheA
MAGDAEFIKAPTGLRQKTGAVTLDLEAIARAEKHLANLSSEYVFWVESDLQKLRQAYDDARAATDEAARNEHIDALFHVAHDMRGQGTTFGYTFVSQICDILCRYLDRVKAEGHVDLLLVAPFTDALRAIINNRVAGETDPIGQAMVKGLQKAVDKRG